MTIVSESQSATPNCPKMHFNRVADNWRPLFAIAEIVGGDWPQRLANAYTKLTRPDADSEGLRVMLLTDIREVFKAERIFSKDLVELLAQMKERPWPEVSRGKPITERWLARQLRSFKIASSNIRIGAEQAKGYELAHFAEVFERYLSAIQGEFIRPTVPKSDFS
jgi:uncharacterized protein DUF3631